jgi:hypothetical protein
MVGLPPVRGGPCAPKPYSKAVYGFRYFYYISRAQHCHTSPTGRGEAAPAGCRRAPRATGRKSRTPEHLETTFFGGRGVGRVSVRESSIKNTELRSQNRTTCNQCCADKAVCTKDEVYTRDSGDSVGLRTHSQPHRFMQVVAAQGLTAPLRPLMHSVAFPISRFSS